MPEPIGFLVSARLVKNANPSAMKDRVGFDAVLEDYKQLEIRAANGDIDAAAKLKADYTKVYTERTNSVFTNLAKDADGNAYITGEHLNKVFGTHLPNVHLTTQCFGELLAKADLKDLAAAGEAHMTVEELEAAVLQHAELVPETNVVSALVTSPPAAAEFKEAPKPKLEEAHKTPVAEAPTRSAEAQTTAKSQVAKAQVKVVYHKENDPHAKALEVKHPGLTLYGPVGDRQNKAYGTDASGPSGSYRYIVTGDPNNIQVTKAPSL